MASSGRYGKYFFLRSHQNRELVAEVKNGVDRPGAAVVVDEARTEEEGNAHQLWYYDKATHTTRNKMNGFCLDLNEDVAVVNPYRRGRTSQQFACSEDRIQSEADFEMVLKLLHDRDVPGTPVGLGIQEGSLAECWSFEYRPPEYFYIRSQDSQMVLDVSKGSTRPGADVILYKDTGLMADNQLWYEDENSIIRSKLNDFAFDASGKNVVLNPYDPHNENMQWIMYDNTIRNKLDSGRILEIKIKAIDKIPKFGKFGRTVSGAFGDHPDIVTAEFVGNVNQLWVFDSLPAAGISTAHSGNGKHFLVRNRSNGMVLEVQGGQSDPGTPVVTSFKNFDARNMDHQLFYEHIDSQTIRSALNDFCLEINDGILVINPYNARPDQMWHVWGKRIQKVDNPDQVLEAPQDTSEPGGYVSAGQYAGEEHQHWEVAHQPAKLFYIVSHLNNKVIDIEKSNAAPGAKINMQDRSSHPSPNQHWYEDEAGVIRAKLNGFVFDSQGKHVEMQPFNPSNKHQQWQIVGDTIMNREVDGYCLDIAKGSKKSGAKICAWQASGTDNQSWSFISI